MEESAVFMATPATLVGCAKAAGTSCSRIPDDYAAAAEPVQALSLDVSCDLIRPIQYLRAVAALMVVWLHALYIIPGAAAQLNVPNFGGAGVDLFFVISGFIMVVTTAAKDVTPTEFLRRRIVRVVPLYWLLTLAVIALAAYKDSFRNLGYPPVAIAKSLLFVPYTSIPGQPGSVWPIALLGWTLNFEMFFYALFAISLAAPRRLRLPGLVLTLGSLVVIGRLFGPFTEPLALVYTSPLLLEFVAGMILAHGWLRDGLQGWSPWSWLFVAVGICAFGLRDANFITQHSGAITMCGAVIIVGACLHPKIYAIQSRPLLELGNASYSIYLFHPFALDALVWGWHRMFPLVTFASSVLFMALALPLCAAVGWSCYQFIERPLTSRLQKSRQKTDVSQRLKASA
jgi:exopolysaccharide production protein ExoZ